MNDRRACVRRLVQVLPALVLAAACASEPGSSSPSASSTPAATSVYAGALPPLPDVQFASARPAPLTRAAYEFAARHPDVLSHMPCFCGCERNGHKNNDNCFVARREADGRPVWSPHGIGCGICIDVALEAARMHKSGARLTDIRAAVDRKFRADHSTSTPTPPVPHDSTPH